MVLRTRTSICAATVIAALASLTACNPIYYSPSTQNVPLLASKGDLSGGASFGDGRIEAHGAYAVGGSLGVELNFTGYSPDDLTNGDGGSGSFAEGGVGMFGGVGGRLRWEVFALGAAGSFENHRPSSVQGNAGTTGDISGNVFRLGVQPALGIRSEHVEAALSTRLARVGYSDVKGSLVFEGRDQVQRLRGKDAYVVLEPALTVRAGLRHVKLQVQLQRSLNLTESDFQQDDGLLTLGLVVRR